MCRSCREDTLFSDPVYDPLWQGMHQAQQRARRRTRQTRPSPVPAAPYRPPRGAAAEALALCYLQHAGLQLLARNLRSPHGELDLIMRDGDTLVFVEVRQRRSSRYGSAADSLQAHKLRRLWRTAEHWLARLSALHFGGQIPPCRFDALLIEAGQARWLRQIALWRP